MLSQSCLTLCDPMACSLPGPSVHGILQARILEWVAMPSSRGSSQPRDQTRFLALQADSLPSELPGKPKNTGVGSLSLFQGIFPTRESNRGLLHHRWILYQLSYQRSPDSRPIVTRSWRKKGVWSHCLMGVGFPLGAMKKFWNGIELMVV